MASIQVVLKRLDDEDNEGEVDASELPRSEKDILVLMDRIQTNPKVKALDLHDCNLTDAAVISIANALPKTSLVSLSLNWNTFTQVGAVAIANSLYKCPSLRELYLGGDLIGDIGVKAISEVIMKGHPLTTLELMDCGITDDGCLVLAKALVGSSITELSLCRNKQITDIGCAALGDALNKLKSLDLSECSITDVGVTSLAFKMKGSPLVELRLTQNNISDIGCQSLGLALKHCSLKELFLDNNHAITDMGVHALIDAARQCPSILWVDLEGNEKVRATTESDLNEVLSTHAACSS